MEKKRIARRSQEGVKKVLEETRTHFSFSGHCNKTDSEEGQAAKAF